MKAKMIVLLVLMASTVLGQVDHWTPDDKVIADDTIWVDPLPMKIDTIGVDTVGWGVDSSSYYSTGSSSISGWYFAVDTAIYPQWRHFVAPILHYTTDTSYYLTDKQVGFLNKLLEINESCPGCPVTISTDKWFVRPKKGSL